MDQRDRGGSGLILGLLSLFALLFGLLVFWELIRPFRNGSIDMKIAVAAGVLGVVLSGLALFRRKGAMILNIVALILNLSGLSAVGFILYSLSHMRLM